MEKFVNPEELEEMMIECESYEFNGLSGKYPDYEWYSFIINGEEVQAYFKMITVYLKSRAGNEVSEFDALGKDHLLKIVDNLDVNEIKMGMYDAYNENLFMEIQLNIETGKVEYVNYSRGSFDLYKNYILLGTLSGFDMQEMIDEYVNGEIEWDLEEPCDDDFNSEEEFEKAYNEYEDLLEKYESKRRDLIDRTDWKEVFADKIFFELNYNDIKVQIEDIYNN